MDFYRNLNEREKKLVLLSLGLLGILLISFLINSVSSDLRNVKRIHKSTESDYLYVLEKANIISANIESQNIKLSGVSIYEHISDNEKLKLLDQESIELRNINGRENLTFTISRLDLLADVVNPRTSVPVSGSLMAIAPIHSPEQTFGKILSFCSAEPLNSKLFTNSSECAR